jgi:hypothetical protein
MQPAQLGLNDKILWDRVEVFSSLGELSRPQHEEGLEIHHKYVMRQLPPSRGFGRRLGVGILRVAAEFKDAEWRPPRCAYRRAVAIRLNMIIRNKVNEQRGGCSLDLVLHRICQKHARLQLKVERREMFSDLQSTPNYYKSAQVFGAYVSGNEVSCRNANAKG